MNSKPTILIIDDDPTMRQTIRTILEEENCHIAEAHDGQHALKFLQSKPVDMIIVDIIMPEKDGIEVIIETTEKYPHIKILSLSGGGLIDADAHLHTAQELGADQTLVKPFKNNDLIDKVHLLLDDCAPIK